MRRLKPHELHNLLNRYGLKVRTCKLQSSLYHKATGYHVQTNRGAYMLKSFRGSTQKLSQVAAIVRALQRQGFTAMPRWMVTRAGFPYVKAQGQLFYLTEWLDGDALGTDEREYRKLGRVLGTLHSASAIKPRLAANQTVQIIRRLKTLDNAHRRAVSQFEHTASREVVKWFRKHGATCMRLADETWAAVGSAKMRRVLQAEQRRQRFVHGDITRMNVIVTGSRVKLLDWDGVRTGSTWMELAKALSNTADFRPSRLQAMLTGYEEVRPLSSSEKKLVAALFRLPREAWVVARHPRMNSSLAELRFRTLEQTWAERLTAIQWMDGWANGEEGIANASERRYSRV